MAIGTGLVSPSGRDIPLIAKILEAFRIRVQDSLAKLISPTRLESLFRQLRASRRLPARLQLPNRALEASSSVMRKPLVPNVAEMVTSWMNDWTQISSKNRHYLDLGEFELSQILDRLCIDRESFRFFDLHRSLIGSNEDVVLSAQIPCDQLYDESGLRLDEVGRQLGQLGLVALSVCNLTTHGDELYLGSKASMEESIMRRKISPRIPFTGIVNVSQFHCRKAEARVDLWQRNTFICRMFVQFDIYSSWQELLPDLKNTL
eukprot:g7571.t1